MSAISMINKSINYNKKKSDLTQHQITLPTTFYLQPAFSLPLSDHKLFFIYLFFPTKGHNYKTHLMHANSGEAACIQVKPLI